MLKMITRYSYLGRLTIPLLCAWAFQSQVSFSAEIRGEAKIIDGDTIKILDATIHLFGVDAPELEQQCMIYQAKWPCGERSVVTLERFIDNKPVRCEIVDKTTAGNTFLMKAHCYNYENVNLNSAIIGAGMALPVLSETKKYTSAGQHAQLKRLGLWSGRFISPADWRDGKRFRQISKPFRRKKLKE